jgi:hypothetical protein
MLGMLDAFGVPAVQLNCSAGAVPGVAPGQATPLATHELLYLLSEHEYEVEHETFASSSHIVW